MEMNFKEHCTNLTEYLCTYEFYEPSFSRRFMGGGML